MKISKRKKRLSKETKNRIALLSIVFAASLLISIVIFNLEQENFVKETIKASSLPRVKIISQEEEYGEFFGYRLPMDIGRLRNGLIPLDKDRSIVCNIDSCGNQIDSLSYIISTIDEEKQIAKDKITDIHAYNDMTSVPLSFSNLIDEGREYMLTLVVNVNNEDLYYYARIKYVEDGRQKECLDFARYFMNTALSDNYSELATYMEPKPGTEDHGLSKVNINSSLSKVGWEGFDISEYSESYPKFAEIDSNYTALELDFIVTGTGDSAGTYLVREYYRMRKGEQRIYLLDFERTMTQIFNDTAPLLNEDSMVLGQNGEELEFVPNRTGSNISFVWNGELFLYNSITGSLIKVFSLNTFDSSNIQALNREYDIDIMNIDENGNLYYMVYGYMHAGEHEGYCGVGLYHYNPIEDTSKEQVFLITDHSYQTLRAGFDNKLFLAPSNNLYVCIEEHLTKSNLYSGDTQPVLSNENNSPVAMSKERRYMAYSNEDGTVITVTDLFSEDSYEILAQGSDHLRVVDFMGEDLVYGIIKEEEWNEENISNNIFPMIKLVIKDVSDVDSENLKIYERSGYYITGIEKDAEFSISFNLSAKSGDIFVERDRDSIKNTRGNTESMASLTYEIEENKEFAKVKFADNDTLEKPSVTIKHFDSMNISYQDAKVTIPASEKNYFYGFRGLDIIVSGANPAGVIQKAYNNMGYCVDSRGNYIWQYGRGNSKKSMDPVLISIAKKTKLNLNGCRLEELLSYVFRGNPVYVNRGETGEAVILGYDERNIVLYFTESKTTETLPISQASEFFNNRGRKFSVYID